MTRKKKKKARQRKRKRQGEQPVRKAASSGGKKPGLPLIAVAVVMLALIVGGILYFAFRDNPPVREKEPSTAGQTSRRPALPVEIQMQVNQAEKSFGAGRFSEAADLLEKASSTLQNRGLPGQDYAHVHYLYCVSLKKADKTQAALNKALQWLKAGDDDAAHHMLAGSLIYDELRYGDAIPHLEKGLSAPEEQIRLYSPDPFTIHCQLADCQRQAGQSDAAARILEAVLARQPTHRIARRTLAFIAFRRRRFDEALSLWDGLFQERPADALVAGQLARTAMEAGDARKVLSVAEKHWSVTKGIRAPRMRLLCAKAFLALGEADKAVGALVALLVLEPGFEEAYFVMGNALLRSGKTDLARAFQQRYMAGAPVRAALGKADLAASGGFPASAVYYKACAHQLGAAYGPALLKIKEARAMSPANGQFAALQAEVLMALGRSYDAADILANFQAFAGKNGFKLPAEFFLARARLGVVMDAMDEATVALRDAIAAGRCEREIAAFACRFVLLGGAHDVLAEALSPFQEKAELDDEITTWFAVRDLMAGRAGEAVAAIETARESSPNPEPFVLLAQGRGYLQLDGHDKARACFQELIRREALLIPAWEGLKAAASQAGDVRQKAEAWLEKAAVLKAQMQSTGKQLHRQSGLQESIASLLDMARFKWDLGERRQARALVLFARFLDKRHIEAHRMVLAFLQEPADLFHRLHSMESLKRLVPQEPELEALTVQEYQKLTGK